jgi:hypothetical protein
MRGPLARVSPQGEPVIAIYKQKAQVPPKPRLSGMTGRQGMHVGLATGFAHQRGKDYDDARFVREEVENLVLAEELGFDSVWITEHHFSDYSMSNDPLQLLTYIAAKTRRVKLGTQCIIVPWHNPAAGPSWASAAGSPRTNSPGSASIRTRPARSTPTFSKC